MLPNVKLSSSRGIGTCHCTQMLALHPPPVEGKFSGMSHFSQDCDRPRNAPDQGASGGPHIMGWIAQGPTAKQRRRESKQS